MAVVRAGSIDASRIFSQTAGKMKPMKRSGQKRLPSAGKFVQRPWQSDGNERGIHSRFNGATAHRLMDSAVHRRGSFAAGATGAVPRSGGSAEIPDDVAVLRGDNFAHCGANFLRRGENPLRQKVNPARRRDVPAACGVIAGEQKTFLMARGNNFSAQGNDAARQKVNPAAREDVLATRTGPRRRGGQPGSGMTPSCRSSRFGTRWSPKLCFAETAQ